MGSGSVAEAEFRRGSEFRHGRVDTGWVVRVCFRNRVLEGEKRWVSPDQVLTAVGHVRVGISRTG